MKMASALRASASWDGVTCGCQMNRENRRMRVFTSPKIRTAYGVSDQHQHLDPCSGKCQRRYSPIPGQEMDGYQKLIRPQVGRSLGDIIPPYQMLRNPEIETHGPDLIFE